MPRSPRTGSARRSLSTRVRGEARIWGAGEKVRVEHHGASGAAPTPSPTGRCGRSGTNEWPPGAPGRSQRRRQLREGAPDHAQPHPPCSVRCAFTPRGTPTSPADPRSPRKALHVRKTRHGGAFALHELGTGAEYYELDVDQQLGVLLAVTAIRDEPLSDRPRRCRSDSSRSPSTATRAFL